MDLIFKACQQEILQLIDPSSINKDLEKTDKDNNAFAKTWMFSSLPNLERSLLKSKIWVPMPLFKLPCNALIIEFTLDWRQPTSPRRSAVSVRAEWTISELLVATR